MKIEDVLPWIVVLVVLGLLIQQIGKQAIIYNNYYLIRQGSYVSLNGDHNNLNMVEGDDNNQSSMA